MNPTDFYSTVSQYNALLRRLHTVDTMMRECQRPRSWAYQMIASYPGEKRLLCNLHTGKKELAIPRTFVMRYLQRVRRGNPYW